MRSLSTWQVFNLLLPWFCRFSFYGTISPGGGGSIMTPALTRFSLGVPLFCPKPLKFYPAVSFYLGAKSIHEEGGGLGF
jgi:hypothetical protein